MKFVFRFVGTQTDNKKYSQVKQCLKQSLPLLGTSNQLAASPPKLFIIAFFNLVSTTRCGFIATCRRPVCPQHFYLQIGRQSSGKLQIIGQ